MPIVSANLQIRDTPEQAADACGDFVLAKLASALEKAPKASLAISGGSTPRLLFAYMAKAKLNWSKVHIFWVDERCVPPADSQSNFKLANDTLLTPAKIPAENIHRVLGELPPEDAAARYVSEIKTWFALPGSHLPVFDVLHRGIGPDAHTASLFPGEPLIKNNTDIAAHVWVEKLKMDRVTLLPGVLRAAKCTVLQVSGADKIEAVHDVLAGEVDEMKYPCQIASRDEKASWFLDKAAAAKL